MTSFARFLLGMFVLLAGYVGGLVCAQVAGGSVPWVLATLGMCLVTPITVYLAVNGPRDSR